jgi:hypothetical protein
MKYLRSIVPEDRLVIFDVKEGWGPLCKVLEKKVPDVEFPRINDGKAIEELTKRFITKGLVRWGIVVSTVGVGVLSFWFMRT